MVTKKNLEELKLEYEDRKDRRKWIKEILQMLLVFLVGAGSGSGITALTLGDRGAEVELAAEVVPDRFVPLILPEDSGYVAPEIEAMLEAGEEPEELLEDLEALLEEEDAPHDSPHE
jgi:hypothetical protein